MRFEGTLFAVPLFLLVLAIATMAWKLPPWVVGLYLAASVMAFIAYAMDKAAAVNATRRTPERRLHLLSLAGGWPGALLAQQVLRHKSSKRAFRRVFWFTVALNLVAFVLLASPLGRHFLKLA